MEVTWRLSTEAWDRTLAAMPPEVQDVYFTPAYHKLHEVKGGFAAHATAVTDGSYTLLVTGLLRAIPGEEHLFDLESCNGYGGPVVSRAAPPQFIASAWRAWQEEAASRGMVAAFMRLHPLLGNHRWLPENATVRDDRETILVALDEGPDSAWAAAQTRHRNMVAKARASHLAVRWNVPEDWESFRALYGARMDAIDARPELRFSRDYFERTMALPGAEIAAVPRNDSTMAGGAIFLWGPTWGHYHLAARAPDVSSAANLILQAAVERAVAKGIRGLHLGGGATPLPDDSVLKFKRSLGTTALSFKVARVLGDTASFLRLEREWSARTGRTPTWLLPYRQPYERPEA